MATQPIHPTHYVYHVRNGDESSKGYWTKIGAVWPHRDDKGFNIDLELIPIDGRIVVREATAKPPQRQ